MIYFVAELFLYMGLHPLAAYSSLFSYLLKNYKETVSVYPMQIAVVRVIILVTSWGTHKLSSNY